MAESKRCPECRSEITHDATVCKFCGERIEGKQCPDCLSFCKIEAKKCKWCGNIFERAFSIEGFRPFGVQADSFATLLKQWRLRPQKAAFTKTKIVITTPGFLGLYSDEEEILWEKIAGFHYKSGIFWDHVSIETRGQTSAEISCLKKKDGKRIRRVLQGLERSE